MTEKLFYEDSHMTEFEAAVLGCEAFGEKYKVVLDRTAFFPEGGGQSGDTGELNGIPVEDTIEKDGIIFHITGEPVEAGGLVRGVLNGRERFSKMQQHTGEHIVSGLVHGRFGYHNVGFHLGSEVVTMDFDGAFTEKELEEIEYRANEAAVSNLEVLVSCPDREELCRMEYRSKKEIDGQVRIVTIPGVDVCACCAPHVKYTGEIGMVKIVGSMRYKGGTRVSMLCGFRALEDYRIKEDNINEISVLLSSKSNLAARAVVRQREEAQKIKDKMIRFQNRYIDEKLKQGCSEGESLILFEEELDGGVMRRFVNEGVKRVKKACICFVGNDEEGYRYVAGSAAMDVRSLSQCLNTGLGGKGGGKPEMVQGSVNGTREQILNELEHM